MCCLLLTLLNEGGDSTSAPGAVCMGYDSPRRPYHGSLDPASMFSCFSTWNSRPLGSGKPTETTALHPPLGVGLGGQRRKTRVSPGGFDPLTFRSPSQHCLTSMCQRRHPQLPPAQCGHVRCSLGTLGLAHLPVSSAPSASRCAAVPGPPSDCAPAHHRQVLCSAIALHL